MKRTNITKKALLTLLSLALLGGSTQVAAWTMVTEPLSASPAPQPVQAATSDPNMVNAVMGFVRSTPAGLPRRTLMRGEGEAIRKILTEAKFTPLDGNYGPNADADGFYNEKMNFTVLVSRSGPMWMTVQKGQPSVELHYEAVLADSN